MSATGNEGPDASEYSSSDSEGYDDTEHGNVRSKSARDVGLTSGKACLGGPRARCAAGGPRAVLATLGVVAVSAYVASTVLSTPPPAPVGSPAFPQGRKASAWSLLQSPDLAEVATVQLMAAAHRGLHDEDRGMVRSIVQAGFGNISLMLLQSAPEVAHKFDTYELSEAQRAGVLGMLHHMGDLRVMRVGAELATSLRRLQDESPVDEAGVESHIVQSMQPRLREIRQLHDEVMPEPLPSPGNVTLEPRRMRLVTTLDVGESESSALRGGRSGDGVLSRRRQLTRWRRPDVTKPLCVASGVAEQARVVLDQLTAILSTGGIDARVPSWVTSLDGKSADPFLADLLGCVDGAGPQSLGLAQLVVCPVKFASAGIDVLSGMAPASEDRAVSA